MWQRCDRSISSVHHHHQLNDRQEWLIVVPYGNDRIQVVVLGVDNLHIAAEIIDLTSQITNHWDQDFHTQSPRVSIIQSSLFERGGGHIHIFQGWRISLPQTKKHGNASCDVIL